MQITRAGSAEFRVWLCRVSQEPAPVRGVCSVCRRALLPTGLGSSKLPQLCERLGLETLRAHGVRVADHGDLAVARWTAQSADGRPNAWRRVVDVVARTS